MSLERKGHSAGFDMVVRGEGRFEVHELGKFFKNRMFVITFHALNLDARSMPSHQCLIRMKKLLENARNSYLLFGFMGTTRIDSISHNFTRGVFHWASSLETGLNCLLVFWERRPLGFTISLFNSTRRRNLGGRLFLSMGRNCTPLNRLEFLIPSLPHWSLAEISWKADNGQMITKAFCWL